METHPRAKAFAAAGGVLAGTFLLARAGGDGADRRGRPKRLASRF